MNGKNTTKNAQAIELAKQLDGREYMQEITAEEAKRAEAAGLVVVFGYSDDNLEFRGTIDDEIGAFDGVEVPIIDGEIMRMPCDNCQDEECPLWEKAIEKARFVSGEFTDGGWKIDTTIPHARFTIYEDGKVFSEGIVFHLDDLREGA